jgi:hypothetical protein
MGGVKYGCASADGRMIALQLAALERARCSHI